MDEQKKTIAITAIQAAKEERILIGKKEFDSFIGGGFVDSQCILLAGLPGAGKSTLLMQISTAMANEGYKVLYISGEESLGQIKLRADRLGTLSNSIFCSEATELHEIYKTIEEVDAKLVIVDSVQMVYSKDIKSERGSPKQITGCFLELIEYIKKSNRIMIAIGHANKAGDIGGLLKLQHMADTILFMKIDKKTRERTLEAKKNRFGSIDEVLPLNMGDHGFSEFEAIGSILARTEKEQKTSLWSRIFGTNMNYDVKVTFDNTKRK